MPTYANTYPSFLLSVLAVESELYYLIAKFLAAGPCNNAARALENELNQNRQLLPHTITYDGKQVPMTMDRLSKEYPNISNNYLLELLGRFLSHFKETGDPTILRVSALRHGDKSLLTMLSAFVPHQEVERCNYLTMTPSQLDKLSIHRMLIAREMGARVLKKNEMPTSLSTFYRERVTISGHRNPVYSVVFDKTNRRLFTGSDDFLVKVWCVRTGYLIHTIRGHQNVITDIAINQENTLIATASTDGCVRVWTMDEYKPIMCLRPNSTAIKPFTTVKFSPSPRAETRYLMATNEDGFVRLWRWDRDTLQFFDVDSPITFSCRFRAKDRLRCSSFDYTGTKFTVAGDDGFVYVFSTVQVQTTHEGVTSHSSGGGGAGHADMSSQDRPGGRGRRKVANALFPDKNSHLQPQPVVSIGTLEGHMGSVTDLAYSHDGQRILSGCQDGTARIWTFNKEYKQWSSITLSLKEPVRADADTVKLSTPASTVMSRSTSINHQDTLNDMASSSTAPSTEEFGTLMPSLDDGFMQSTTTTTDMDLDESEHPPAAFLDPPKVSMIAWSADDRWCFVASNYGDIRVYYASSGDIACVLKGHEGEIYALDNHPLDSSTILSAGYDGNVILWDVQKKKVINCTQHRGRTFTDCKFSKDGMKYAITDEEGHCTLFGIGGLDKDYEQVRSWERGQYFMSDYQALRHFADGSFVDEPTQQPPYAMPSSPIIDLQGVAYPNQKKLGYGRNIPTTPETFELEDMRRSACYDQEEEEIRALKCITLPALDRATVAKRRREFVRFEDDEEGDLATAGNIQFQFPPPVLPALLPDDSADEDYHDDEAGNAGYASSANSSDDERGSDEFVTRDNEVVFNSDDENDEEGPVTRSRAGQTPIRTPRTTAPSSNNTLRHATTARRRGRGRGAGVGRGRGRGGRGGSRATRKRNRDASDEEEDQPVRARTRRRVTERPSYAESDFESEEDEFVNVDNDPSDAQDSDHSEAGPSNRAAHYTIDTGDLASSSAAFTTTTEPAEPQDRKGKRKLRSAAAATTTTTTTAHASDDEFTESPYQLRQYQHYMQHQASTSSSSGGGVTMPSTSTSTGRATRSRAHLPDIPVVPVPSHSHKPPATAAASSTTATTTAAAKASNNKRSAKHRDGPRELTEDEIKEHEPIPWITNTERSLAKYLPQVGDMVAILTEGHKQYLKKSQMRHLFDEKHGVIDKHEPVLFARVNSISWLVGPPAYCKLKLHMLELHNLPQVIQGQEEPLWSSLQQDHIIEYTDEDDSPEFIVLWERFLASMNVFLTLDVGQKVDAIYDEGQYTGTVSSVNNHGQIWKQANLPSPWAFYHVIWDDASSNAEDLSPWELVPTGEDFRTRYDVGSTLTPAQIKRAKDTIAWLESVDDFYLYVHQVNYYDYPPYLSVIAYPICLDTVKERLGNGYYRTVDGLLDDVELIKKNAMKYNAESSPAHKNAIRLAHFFKTRIQKPSMPLAFSRGGGKKKVVVEESDDEYDNDVEEQKYESEEEPRISRKERHYSDEEDDFVDEDDDEDDYYG